MNEVVFIVVGEDRHSGLSIHKAYRLEADAVANARNQALKYSCYNNSVVEETHSTSDACVYRGVYSCENDYMAVYRKEVK